MFAPVQGFLVTTAEVKITRRVRILFGQSCEKQNQIIMEKKTFTQFLVIEINYLFIIQPSSLLLCVTTKVHLKSSLQSASVQILKHLQCFLMIRFGPSGPPAQ